MKIGDKTLAVSIKHGLNILGDHLKHQVKMIGILKLLIYLQLSREEESEEVVLIWSKLRETVSNS